MNDKKSKEIKENFKKWRQQSKEKELDMYIEVLATVCFPDAVVALVKFNEMYHDELLKVSNFIKTLKLSKNKEELLLIKSSGFWCGSDGKTEDEIEEYNYNENLKYYEHLIGWAKETLNSLPIDKKKDIVRQTLVNKELWSNQLSRTMKVMNENKAKKVIRHGKNN